MTSTRTQTPARPDEDGPSARRPSGKPLRSDALVKAEAVIEATVRLLETHRIGELSMSLIAQEAGIPRTSIYHLYSDIFGVLAEVARRHVLLSREAIGRHVDALAPRDVFELIDAHVAAAADYFNSHAAARKTLYGAAALELHSVYEDYDILAAGLFRESIQPDWPVEPLSEADPFRTVTLILTAIYAASVRRHDTITAEARVQAVLAARSYLSAELARIGCEAPTPLPGPSTW